MKENEILFMIKENYVLNLLVMKLWDFGVDKKK